MQKKLPIGEIDFKTIIEQGCYFVDKSLLIKDVLDAWAKVLLIPRPRRFGKTLNMEMLFHFFRKSEEDAAHLFRDLAVARHPEVMEHQGKYPVVAFNLKEVRGTTWPAARGLLEQLLSDFCRTHTEIADGMDHIDRRDFESLVERKASEPTLRNSLRNLAIWLKRYHEHQVIILLDEYDTPILEAYAHGYYEDMISFMRSWLGEGLKLERERGVLYKAVVTGIMRVAKESMFSGLNNLKVFPLQETSPFEGKFGFTQTEIEQLLAHYGLEAKLDEVNDWYNGYQFGRTTIYNPWSIIHYVDSQPSPPAPHWLNTSQNQLIYDALRNISQAVRDQLEVLLGGGEITQPVTDAAVLREGARARDIWSFMLSAGYLTSRGWEMGPRGPEYRLAIPNRELRSIFSETVERWLEQVWASEQVGDLLAALLAARWQHFEALLQQYVLSMLSFHDLAANKPAEAVIQAFVLGLLANLTHLYQIRSNREEGQGRADIVMTPLGTPEDAGRDRPGLVIELKAIGQEEDLDRALDAALSQIDEKQYSAGLEAQGVADIAKVAIVLQGKTVKVRAR